MSVRFDDEAHQPGPDAAGSTSTRSSEDERSGSPPWAARPALPARRSLGKLVGSVVNGVVSLFRKEIELAKMELVASISARAKGTGMFAAAVVLTLFAVGFLAASASTALAIVVPTWTANAIVGVVFLVIAVVVVPIARRQMRTPPIAPEQTRRTLKEEVEWAKQQIRR